MSQHKRAVQATLSFSPAGTLVLGVPRTPAPGVCGVLPCVFLRDDSVCSRRIRAKAQATTARPPLCRTHTVSAHHWLI